MARSSSDLALNAIHIFIGLNVLAYIFRDDLDYRLNLSKRHRVFDAYVIPMFHHIDPGHLAINMLALHQYGNEIFVRSSSKRWRSHYMVIFSYMACGLLTLKGLEVLSTHHEEQWKSKLNNAINQGIGVDITSYLTNAWSELTSLFPFADMTSSIYHFQLVRRIGASGVIYGWMGMRLFTSFFSQHHSRMGSWDFIFLVGILARNLSKTPLTLDELKLSTFLEGDGIDHAAHLLGAVGGMFLALLILVWDKIVSMQGRWNGQGIRLGQRYEDDRSQIEQERQRRERSRLLNQQSRNGRDRAVL